MTRLASEARSKYYEEVMVQLGTTFGRAPSLERYYFRVFFAGVQPRVMWISIGGFVFFGAYEQVHKLIFPLVS